MRSFGPIVQPLVLAMFDPGGDLGFGRSVGTELVGDQHSWLAPPPEQLSKEAFGCACVPTRLDQDIQHIAIGVDRPPEPVLFALDRDHDFVEMPFVRRAGPLAGSALPASVAANSGARPNGSLDSTDAAYVAAS